VLCKFGLLFDHLFLLSNRHLDVNSSSSCDWFNSKAIQCLINNETGTADFDLSGDTNIEGMPAWKNDTKTRKNHGKLDINTKLLIENKHRFK